jgi:hypothetical protein
VIGANGDTTWLQGLVVDIEAGILAVLAIFWSVVRVLDRRKHDDWPNKPDPPSSG